MTHAVPTVLLGIPGDTMALPLLQQAAALRPADPLPLRQSPRACQRLGQAAASDPGCLVICAENRDRFLGRTPAPVSPQAEGGR